MAKRYHSFSSRITWRVLLVLMVMMSFIALMVFSLTMWGMISQSREHFKDILDLTDERVQTMLTAVEVSTVNNLDAVEDCLAKSGDVFDAMEKELRLNPHIVGCASAFIPDYFPDKHWFEPYVARREGGVIERLQIGSESHDYFKSPWYNTALACTDGYWSDPYYDEAGARELLCTFSRPIHGPDGRIVGVYGADVSLEWLTAQLRDIDEKANGGGTTSDLRKRPYSFIIGRNGEYIAHPDPQRTLYKRFADFAPKDASPKDTSYAHINAEMLAARSGYGITNVDGLDSFVLYAPIEGAGWSVAVVVPMENVYAPGLILALMVLFVIILGVIILFAVTHYTVRRITKPLVHLARSAGEIAKGKFDTPLPEIRHNDEVRQLRDSFADMETSLSEYVRQLTDTTAQKASIESELSVARGIQMSMVPKEFPPYPDRTDIDVYASLTPAKAVGGDFYDFFLRDDRLFFCIGDVSGKGIPAALVMTMIATHFRSLASSEDSPARIADSINKSVESHNDSMMFVTLFIGVLDLASGVMKFCNAGHNAPALTGRGVGFLKVEPNVPVGVMPDWQYSEQQVQVHPGSTIFLYTDGLTEAENPEHTLFGEDRLTGTLEETADTRPVTLIDAMKEAVDRFVGDAEQADDLTMLAIRFTGNL